MWLESFMKKNLGISLLEILLVLATIGVVLILTLRYFTLTTQNENISQTVNQIQSLTKASYQWLQIQRQADFSSSNAIDINKLQQAQLIDGIETKDAWGGDVTLAPSADGNYVHIALDQIPEKACRNLRQKMKTIAHAQTENDDCSKNGYFIEL